MEDEYKLDFTGFTMSQYVSREYLYLDMAKHYQQCLFEEREMFERYRGIMLNVRERADRRLKKIGEQNKRIRELEEEVKRLKKGIKDFEIDNPYTNVL